MDRKVLKQSPSEFVEKYLDWKTQSEESLTGEPLSDPDLEEKIADRLDLMEVWMLARAPANMVEVICLIDVAAENLLSGGRSDGSDYRALVAVQKYLAGLVLPEEERATPLSVIRENRMSASDGGSRA